MPESFDIYYHDEIRTAEATLSEDSSRCQIDLFDICH